MRFNIYHDGPLNMYGSLLICYEFQWDLQWKVMLSQQNLSRSHVCKQNRHYYNQSKKLTQYISTDSVHMYYEHGSGLKHL